jgi:uncharacterized membrane protein YkvA (DUF1232 family)
MTRSGSRSTFNERFKAAAGPYVQQFRRAPLWVKIVASICLGYLLIPIDPWDVLLPWLAWQDDLFIAGLLLKLLHKYGAEPNEELKTAKDLIRELFTKNGFSRLRHARIQGSKERTTVNMNKAVIESYLRNLLGQVIGAVMIVMQTSGVSSPIDFGTGEWLLVANALWASLIPVLLRWVNKADPAFGAVAEAAAKEVTKKLATAARSAKKKPTVKSSPKPAAKKKPAARK